MIELRILDPRKGDVRTVMSEEQAAETILEEKKKGRASFGKWSDDQVLDLMNRTGISTQLKTKEELVQELEGHDGQTLTLVPPIAGG